jgi:protein TonB
MLSRKFKKQKFPLFRRLMVIIPVTLALAVFTVHIEAKSMHVQDVVSYKDAIVKPLFNDKNSENNFANWILSCLDYPQNAREQGIDGVVAISFIIDTDGSVKNTTVTNQINSMLSDELVGHVNQSPKWTPGKDAAGNPIPVSHTFSAYFRIEYPKDESYAIASDKVEKLSEEIKNADVILVAVGKNASEALEKHNRVSFSIDESGSLSDIKLETEPLPGDFLPDGSDKAEKNPNENKDVIKVAFKKAPVINDTVYAEHFAVCGGFEFDEGINDTIYVKPPDELQKSEGSKNKEIVVVAFGTEKKAASDKAKENQCLGMNFTPDRRDSVKKTVTNIDTVPFSDVEEKPKFQGKDADAFVEYVYSQIVYPTEAIAKNIEGNVRIVFIINEDGSLSDIKSVKEVDPLLENVVLGIVEKSPKWTPGKHKNKLVKVTYQIPVIFKLSK